MEVAMHIVRFNAQTAGRDKLCRLVQYGSRALWGALAQLDHWPLLTSHHSYTHAIDRGKDVEYFVSNVRKLLRFGKSLEVIMGAVRNLRQVSDGFVRFTLVLGKINQSVYLLVDHLILVGRLRLARLDLPAWGRVSARFWLASLILSLARDLYDLLSVLQRGDDQGGTPSPRRPRRVLLRHKALILDTVKNTCDLFLPLNSLGRVTLRPHTVGLLGVVSSLIGILQLARPGDCKLNPS